MSPSSSNPICSHCGSILPDGVPENQCPRCLMAQVMQPTQEAADEKTLAPLAPDALAPHFPQLDIMECLGRGGMGVVYKARQKSLNRLVALKLLAPERVGDPQFAARFEREAQALAALNHPHIVAVHDFGRAGGFYYLIMEFVDGLNLRQLLQKKRLTPKEALSIVPPVCDALQCAHDHGIVHRDIKPENLLMDTQGVVKIADFGIAKIVASADDKAGTASAAPLEEPPPTMPFGTPDYAAPEQADGQADHRADIYSLGVVLYEMLTGELPHGKIEAPSKRVKIDIRIDEIVLKALDREPEMRFATAQEFRQQVEAAVTTLPESPAPAATTSASASTSTSSSASTAPVENAIREAAASTRVKVAMFVVLTHVAVAFLILLSVLRVGIIEGVIVLALLGWALSRWGLLTPQSPAVLQRVVAKVAWLLWLPMIGFALILLPQWPHGFDHPSPVEAVLLPLCLFWIFALPASGIVLWNGSIRKQREVPKAGTPPGNPWPRRIFILLLIFLLGPLLVAIGGVLIPSYHRIKQEQQLQQSKLLERHHQSR